MDRRLKPGQTVTPEHKRGYIFRALSVARRGYTAMLRPQKIMIADAFVFRYGLKFFFSAFFAGFNPGLT